MLILTEHTRSEPVFLTIEQQTLIRDWFKATLEPAPGGLVTITPGPYVGSADIQGLRVVVRPKVAVDRILQLISESADPYRWLQLDAEGLANSDLQDAVAALFLQACRRTFERGLYRSYHRERQRLPFIRGRILIPQMVRAVTPIPITVEADVFDDDVAENHVLAAALRVVRISTSLAPVTRSAAYEAWKEIKHVTPLPDSLRGAENIVWTRRNQYYRQAVELAKLVLRAGTVEQSVGTSTLPGFVIDMPRLVEQWVRVRLRRAWDLDERQMPDSWKSRLWLDSAHKTELQPDLAVRLGEHWAFLGDVKYKVLEDKGVRREDMYQMLAYLTATDMDEGVLLYLGTSSGSETRVIPQTGARIRVVGVDLSSPTAGDDMVRSVGGLR